MTLKMKKRLLLLLVRARLPAVLHPEFEAVAAGGCHNWVVPGLAPGLDPLEGTRGLCGWRLAEPVAEEPFRDIAMGEQRLRRSRLDERIAD